MKKSVNRVVFLDMLFLLLLVVSGYITTGVLSNIVYYLAFLVPIGAGLFILRKSDGGYAELRLLGEAKRAAIPLILTPFTLGGILILSAATQFLFRALALPMQTLDVSGVLTPMLVVDAVVPAILEEILFRYIPLKFLAPHSKAAALWFSAILFAASHVSLYQLPYALAAGAMFALVDLAAGSILPSVALHLVNNVLSLLLLRRFGTNPLPALALGTVLFGVGLLFMHLYRDVLAPLFAIRKSDEERVAPPASVVVYLAVCAVLICTAVLF